jgi:hypothetical protein
METQQGDLESTFIDHGEQLFDFASTNFNVFESMPAQALPSREPSSSAFKAGNNDS